MRGERLPRGAPVDLELRVASAVYGSMLRLPLTVPTDGTALFRQPPEVDAELPLTLPAGPLDVRVTARDDRAVASVTAWLDREKVAWRSGGGPKARLDLSLELSAGAHSLVVVAEDDDGATTRREWQVRGLDPE